MRHISIMIVAMMIAIASSACGSQATPTSESTPSGAASGVPSGIEATATSTTSVPVRTSTPTRRATTPTPPIPPASPTPFPTDIPAPGAVVVADTLNLREGPDTSYQVVKQIGKDTPLVVFGQFRACSWLKVALTTGEQGWVSGASEYVALNISCDGIAHGTYRPRTGTIKAASQGGSLGELEVENGTDLDGIVIISVGDDGPIAAAYVRATESFTIRGIPDGTYLLFFSTGDAWDGELAEFTVSPSYQRFEDTFVYTTDSKSYTVWNVTLHSVTGGTAKADSVDPDNFPRIAE